MEEERESLQADIDKLASTIGCLDNLNTVDDDDDDEHGKMMMMMNVVLLSDRYTIEWSL